MPAKNQRAYAIRVRRHSSGFDAVGISTFWTALAGVVGAAARSTILGARPCTGRSPKPCVAVSSTAKSARVTRHLIAAIGAAGACGDTSCRLGQVSGVRTPVCGARVPRSEGRGGSLIVVVVARARRTRGSRDARPLRANTYETRTKDPDGSVSRASSVPRHTRHTDTRQHRQEDRTQHTHTAKSHTQCQSRCAASVIIFLSFSPQLLFPLCRCA